MARCSTAHGPFRCDKEEGHTNEFGVPTECETSTGPSPRVVLRVDRDAQRELAKAAARVVRLEAALEEIRTTPCEANGNASCLCCLHDRMVATDALKAETQ